MSKRIVSWVAGALLLLPGSAAYATPSFSLVAGDPYGASTVGDVIGLKADFDINKIVLSSDGSGLVHAEVWTNYHNSTLAPWTFDPGGVNLLLSVGDLLFDVNGTYKYGVAVTGHDSLVAGKLYAVTDLRTSDEALTGYSVSYRTGQNVQIEAGTLNGSGSVSVGSAGSGDPTQLLIALDFTPDASSNFWNDISSSNWSVHFASASCANDVADGDFTPVPTPEPGTLLLLGSGLVGLGAAARRRFART